MIREKSATGTNGYVYGLDLSQSLQGAGTIGGLVWASLDGTEASYAYDANGNVANLVATDGVIVATYDYDPYGNLVSSSGTLADDNPYRFSTKYADEETGLVYYGFRFYSPSLGRWLNRDPIGEVGGLNLYACCMNSGVNLVLPVWSRLETHHHQMDY